MLKLMYGKTDDKTIAIPQMNNIERFVYKNTPEEYNWFTMIDDKKIGNVIHLKSKDDDDYDGFSLLNIDDSDEDGKVSLLTRIIRSIRDINNIIQ